MSLLDRIQTTLKNADRVDVAGNNLSRGLFSFDVDMVKRSFVAAVAVGVVALSMSTAQAAPLSSHEGGFNQAINYETIPSFTEGLVDKPIYIQDTSNLSRVVDAHQNLFNLDVKSIESVNRSASALTNLHSPAGVTAASINGKVMTGFLFDSTMNGGVVTDLVEKVINAHPDRYSQSDVKAVYDSFGHHEAMHLNQEEKKASFFSDLDKSMPVMDALIQKFEASSEVDLPTFVNPDVKEAVAGAKGLSKKGVKGVNVVLSPLEEAKSDVYAALIEKQAGHPRATDFLIEIRKENPLDVVHWTVRSLEDSKSITQTQLQSMTKKQIAEVAENIAVRNETTFGREHRGDYTTSIEKREQREQVDASIQRTAATIIQQALPVPTTKGVQSFGGGLLSMKAIGDLGTKISPKLDPDEVSLTTPGY